jgi:hypothetical protein
VHIEHVHAYILRAEKHMENKMRRLILCGLIAAIIAFTSLGAFAQGSAESSVRGNLSGTVVDSSGAIITGAKVAITGPTGTKSDTTNQDGNFLFPLLTPGFYSIKVEKGSFKTADAKGVEVVTGKTSNLRIGMVAGQQTEVVEVSGSAITVDTTSTAVSANLTDTFYQSVPVARGVTGLFYASPGVTSGGGTGTANPSISGGTGLENLYVADGVNITDGGFGGIGVYSRQYGSLSTGINLSFVKEVQVKTGGFEAQYGKSTGGIVQIVTKSGGSALHGVVGGYFAPQSFEATRLQADDFANGSPDQKFNLGGKIMHQSAYDLDAEVGGQVPGLGKKLFFFGSFNPSWNTDHDQFAQFRNGTDCGAGVFVSPCTGNSQPNFNNVDLSNRVYSYAGKLTFKVNDRHQFETSIFGDPTYGDNSPNNATVGLVIGTNTTLDKLQYGTRNWVVRYNGALTPSWLVNASYSWGHNNLSDTPGTPGVTQIDDLVQRLPCGFIGSIAPPPCVNDPAPGSFAAAGPMRGRFIRQGLGYFENTTGDNYGLNLDTSKSFRFLGEHNVGIGYSFARSHYDGDKARTGARIPVDAAFAGGLNLGAGPAAALAANGTDASFQLRLRTCGSPLTVGPCPDGTVFGQVRTAACVGGTQAAELYIPGVGGPNACPDGGVGVRLRQVRGEFGDPNFKTQGDYHTLFAQDSWSINKFVTVNAGLRWEQQRIAGKNASYTFTDNWSPRVGVSIDPWGNRKTKIFANFGRYNESIPLDMGIRSLSSEFDFPDTNWRPPTDGAGHVLLNPDGTINLSTLEGTQSPVNPADGYIISTNSGAAVQDHVAFAPGTRMQYLDEYVLGFEHEFGNSGVIFTARYMDRRIKRIVEDMAELTPEAAQALDAATNLISMSQIYLIGNPSQNLDVFKNVSATQYVSDPITGLPGPPSGCTSAAGNLTLYADPFLTGSPTDSNGNFVTNSAGNNAICIPNAIAAGPDGLFGTVDDIQLQAITGADGIKDGFVDPIRIYKSMEFEVNKSFSKNWQLRANYRIAKLFGNYEGSFRNDNAQSDPNISSLFDFTRGDFNLLGQQFVAGVLNTDVRHLANGYVSYVFGNHFMKGLTLGTGVHFQTGIPINNLYAHPVYANAGELPFCADNTTNCASARGSEGRTHNWGNVDLHADYPIRLTEKTKIRLAADLFNLTDMRTQLRVDDRAQITVGTQNSDFLKPRGNGPSGVTGNTNPGYQRPFYARFGVKFEF